MTSPEASHRPLRQLSERLGVAAAYHDFWGHPKQLDTAQLSRFVTAMGMDAQDDASAEQALRRLDDDAAAHPLPTVHVMRASAPKPVQLGDGVPPGTVCTLVTESGETWQGRVDEAAPGRRSIALPEPLPLGYHRLAVAGVADACTVIVCPDRCHEPPGFAQGERWWGPTVQLYALRSARNWGIGDFTDLQATLDMAAAEGAAFVGINPLHALFPHDPERASPYSPSSRIALNALYLDVEAISEFLGCSAARNRVRSGDFQCQLQRLRDAPHVDYSGVASAKRQVLELLYRHFREVELARDTPRAQAFRRFQQQGGAWLRAHALFDAIQAHLHANDASIWGWVCWPPAFREAGSPEVVAFEREQIERVEFFEYLQWQCDAQLAAVASHARALGMPLGLYRDVAVGVNEGGSETWGRPGLYGLGMSAGAPPEAYNPAGQSWGLPPMVPSRLREQAYAPFSELLRENMRHAGALRLDHAMALQRLFWVPSGADAREGTYVSYPFEDLLNVLALESVRNQCLVIGEDLGNVPEGFRETVASRGVLSYCPLYFERNAQGRFPAPGEWRANALAVVGTHDLPTLRAWWRGDDIETRSAFGLYPDEQQRHDQIISRAEERVRLLLSLEGEQLMPAGGSLKPATLDDNDSRLTEAVYAFLGRSQSRLVGIQFEDVIQQLEQVNVPSTTEETYPNWRVKLKLPLEQIGLDPRWRAVTARLREGRSRFAPTGRGSALPALDTACIPRATYRIQFHAGMRFEAATRLVPYLDALGVSHLYASPYLAARRGSTHGYDIVDHNALNPEVGTPEDHDALCQALAAHGMHQLLDIVPNHMGVLEADNAWWLDVLECGEASAHAATFDIEWNPAAPELRGKVLLPVLGDHYGRVLEAGELKLAFDPAAGAFHIAYYDHRFPLDPRTFPDVFAAVPAPDDGESGQALAVVQSLLDAFGHLPERDSRDTALLGARRRDKVLHKQQLAEACARHAWLRDWIDACVARLNGTPGTPSSFDGLDHLIERQAYRLAFWRVAGDDVNYRRFFDISTLAALRMERPEVFEDTHRTVLRWLGEGRLSGLRIDHPDGLADPRGYFERLQQRHQRVLIDAGRPPRALYVSVEKILAEHEHVPSDWPVHGGTGYRFSNQVNGVFVDGRHEQRFDEIHARFVGSSDSFDEILREAKLLVMSTALASDLQWLTEALFRIAQHERTSRDFTRNRLRAALVETAAGFPVYRTYIGPAGVEDRDRQHTAWAVAEAKRHTPAADVSAIDFLQDVLLGAPSLTDATRRAEALAFVSRWQQFTAPVMAKSMEDTAFYRYHRLISLNDVGGDPRRFGMSVSAFHAANVARSRFLPHTMLGTSTHDSKRSEDVRARIDVLSEIPDAWEAAVQRWSAMNRPRAERSDSAIPAADEYLLYQTLVGVWPLGEITPEVLGEVRGRVQAYMQKAVREAKVHTSWINPNEASESALARFIDHLLGTRDPNPFLTDFEAWVAPVSRFGCWNSLSQVALKLTSPGVPDVYQGCEVWNFSLVDPDNRRPVDFDGLRAQLRAVLTLYEGDRLPPDAIGRLAGALDDGRLKLLMTARLLALRRTLPQVFTGGAYQALELDGPAASHAIAYARQHESGTVVVVASRLLSTLTAHDPSGLSPRAWAGTQVNGPPAPPSGWRDWLTGRRVGAGDAGATGALPLDQLLADFPFAVLVPATLHDPLVS